MSLNSNAYEDALHAVYSAVDSADTGAHFESALHAIDEALAIASLTPYQRELRKAVHGEAVFVSKGEFKSRRFYRPTQNAPVDEAVMKVIDDHWKLERPNVILSITGAAGPFDNDLGRVEENGTLLEIDDRAKIKMKKRLHRFFKRGIGKAAQKNNMWLITGGTNGGVMKATGDAVRELADEGQYITSIGIATYGRVFKKEVFSHQTGARKTYKCDVKPEPGTTILNPDHTHFILYGSEDGQFGAEVPFRFDVEDRYHTCGVPMVGLCVNGGPGTIATVVEFVNGGIPCVVVKGTGRVADIIAFAWEHNGSVDEDLLTRLIQKQFQLWGLPWSDQYLKSIFTILRRGDIRIFDLALGQVEDVQALLLGSAQTVSENHEMRSLMRRGVDMITRSRGTRLGKFQVASHEQDFAYVNRDFLRPPSGVSTDQIISVLEMRWKLQPPAIVVSVTGSDVGPELKRAVRKAFEGIVSAVNKKGYIITAATKSISKVVAVAKQNQNLSNESDVPLIGICSLNSVYGKHTFVKQKQVEFKYPEDIDEGVPEDGDGVKKAPDILDPHHTHFILMGDAGEAVATDDGEDGETNDGDATYKPAPAPAPSALPSIPDEAGAGASSGAGGVGGETPKDPPPLPGAVIESEPKPAAAASDTEASTNTQGDSVPRSAPSLVRSIDANEEKEVCQDGVIELGSSPTPAPPLVTQTSKSHLSIPAVPSRSQVASSVMAGEHQPTPSLLKSKPSSGGVGRTASTPNEPETPGELAEFQQRLRRRANREADLDPGRALRGQLEEWWCSKLNTAVVKVVCSGGPTTIRTALRAVRSGITIITLKNTGNSADAIAHFHENYHKHYSYAADFKTLLAELRAKLSHSDTILTVSGRNDSTIARAVKKSTSSMTTLQKTSGSVELPKSRSASARDLVHLLESVATRHNNEALERLPKEFHNNGTMMEKIKRVTKKLEAYLGAEQTARGRGTEAQAILYLVRLIKMWDAGDVWAEQGEAHLKQLLQTKLFAQADEEGLAEDLMEIVEDGRIRVIEIHPEDGDDGDATSVEAARSPTAATQDSDSEAPETSSTKAAGMGVSWRRKSQTASTKAVALTAFAQSTPSADREGLQRSSTLTWGKTSNKVMDDRLTFVARMNVAAKKESARKSVRNRMMQAVLQVAVELGTIGVENIHHQTSLMYAAVNGNTQMAARMLADGDKIFTDADAGPNALVLSLMHNHTDIALMVSAKARESKTYSQIYQSKDEWGNTALHWAAFRGIVPIMEAMYTRCLQEANRDGDNALQLNIDKMNHYGETALHYAVRGGSVEAVTWLLAHKADPLSKPKRDFYSKNQNQESGSPGGVSARHGHGHGHGPGNKACDYDFWAISKERTKLLPKDQGGTLATPSEGGALVGSDCDHSFDSDLPEHLDFLSLPSELRVALHGTMAAARERHKTPYNLALLIWKLTTEFAETVGFDTASAGEAKSTTKKSSGHIHGGSNEELAKATITLSTQILDKFRLTLPMDLSTEEAHPKTKVATHRQRFALEKFARGAGQYVLFLSLVCVVALLMTSQFSVGGHLLRSSIVGELFEEEFLPADAPNIKKTFVDIGNSDEWWQWVFGPMIGVVFPMSENVTHVDPMLGHNALIGTVRMRQARVQGEPCGTTVTGSGLDTCYPTFNTDRLDTSTFEGVIPYVYSEQKPYNLGQWGEENWFPNAGHSVELHPHNASQVVEALGQMQASDWIDSATRMVFLDFAVYNANTDHIAVISAQVEFLFSGAAMADYSIMVFPYELKETVLTRATITLQSILFFANVVLFMQEVSDLRDEFLKTTTKASILKRCRDYVFSDFNLWDLLSLCLFFVTCSVHLAVREQKSALLGDGLDEHKFYEFDSMVRSKALERDAVATFVLVSFGKILKYVQIIPVAGPAMQAILHTVSDSMITTFLCFFFSFAAATTLAFHIAFGPSDDAFKTYESSWFTVLRSLFGDIAFDFVANNKGYMGPGFLAGYAGMLWTFVMVMGNLIIMNIIIAVISKVYETAQTVHSEEAWEAMLSKMMAETQWDKLPSKRQPIGLKQKLKLRFDEALNGRDREYPVQCFDQSRIRDVLAKAHKNVNSKEYKKKKLHKEQDLRHNKLIADNENHQMQVMKLAHTVSTVVDGMEKLMKRTDELQKCINQVGRKLELQIQGGAGGGAGAILPD